MDAGSLLFLTVAGALVTLVGVLNGWILFRAPRRYPESPNETVTMNVGMPTGEVVSALEGLRSFEPHGRIEEGDATTFVQSAPMTAGMSGRRTYGHWMFVRVRPGSEGATVDVAINNKWWESSTWAREERAKRHARVIAEVRKHLELE
ncbi:MAG: hypothetical protein AB8I08_00725 [Sandaracinaceae bacterium]